MFQTQTSPTHTSRFGGGRIEWGPAHLREDAVALDVEPTDRPDDN
ncbi:hypothetical protein [Aeromicrobium sp. CF3.5]